MNNQQYRCQVALLVRILPLVYKIKDFAIHGGTAINLFHQDMPRYSVDIDLTYIPLEPRSESVDHINQHLRHLKEDIERAIPQAHVVHKPDILKLQCRYQSASVKIEVNGTKRGLIGEPEIREICQKAQKEFQAYCKARLVSYSQLYGGKIVAALSRQHPRDLFDCKYMGEESLDRVKDGIILCLLGSDKPIVESLCPNKIDQLDALENQFKGMSDIPFTYQDYEESREVIINKVNSCITKVDKEFLISFENGTPEWDLCCAGDLSRFPSVQWKLINIQKLKKAAPEKHRYGLKKLQEHFDL